MSGLQADLTAQGIPFQALRVDFADVDGAVLQGDTRGFLKLQVAAESGAILGASIVGSEAASMICQVATAMQVQPACFRPPPPPLPNPPPPPHPHPPGAHLTLSQKQLPLYGASTLFTQVGPKTR